MSERVEEKGAPQDWEAPPATTELPLQAQLMGSLALVLVLSTIAGLLGYATFDGRSLENSVRAKASMYATNLTQQLYGPMQMRDAMVAEQALEPLFTDRNVYGVAVYSPEGRRLAGHGIYPETLVSGQAVTPADDRVLLTLRDIPAGDGQVGHLYLALIHPATRHALRGMTLGDVREDWAEEHHPKWVEERHGL